MASRDRRSARPPRRDYLERPYSLPSLRMHAYYRRLNKQYILAYRGEDALRENLDVCFEMTVKAIRDGRPNAAWEHVLDLATAGRELLGEHRRYVRRADGA